MEWLKKKNRTNEASARFPSDQYGRGSLIYSQSRVCERGQKGRLAVSF